jgi:hypothetical protein
MKPANLITDKTKVWALHRKKNKMGAKKTKVDGITFDSQAEARRFVELKFLRDFGEVSMFLRQPMFDLPGNTKYRADFLIFWESGQVTVEDVKGHRTDAYIRAKAQVEALYPITIEERKA